MHPSGQRGMGGCYHLFVLCERGKSSGKLQKDNKPVNHFAHMAVGKQVLGARALTENSLKSYPHVGGDTLLWGWVKTQIRIRVTCSMKLRPYKPQLWVWDISFPSSSSSQTRNPAATTQKMMLFALSERMEGAGASRWVLRACITTATVIQLVSNFQPPSDFCKTKMLAGMMQSNVLFTQTEVVVFWVFLLCYLPYSAC